MRGYSRRTPQEDAAIMDMRAAGYSFDKIAEVLGLRARVVFARHKLLVSHGGVYDPTKSRTLRPGWNWTSGELKKLRRGRANGLTYAEIRKRYFPGRTVAAISMKAQKHGIRKHVDIPDNVIRTMAAQRLRMADTLIPRSEPTRVWCEQCQRQVAINAAAVCASRFCKAQAA